MPHILLYATQTRTHRTLSFQILGGLLREAGNDVTMCETAHHDGVQHYLEDTAVDQVWLFAADDANGLSPDDVRGLLRFRESGGAMLTARGTDDVGASLLNLGALGGINHFRSYNRAPHAARRPALNSALPFSRIHSSHPLHPALRAGDGTLAYAPARARGGNISLPSDVPSSCVVARDGAGGALVIAVDGGTSHPHEWRGRAIVTASNHLFEDADLRAAMQQPQLFDTYTAWLCNLAQWLGWRSGPLRLRELLGGGLRVCEPKVE